MMGQQVWEGSELKKINLHRRREIVSEINQKFLSQDSKARDRAMGRLKFCNKGMEDRTR